MNEIIKKNGIQFGSYASITLIAILIIMYVIDLKLFSKPYMLFIQVIAIIILGVLVIKKSKSDLNNFISFKDAFTSYFIMIVIAILASTIVSIILFNFIDTEASAIVNEHIIRYVKDMLERFGTPASEVKEAIEEIKNDDLFSISNQLTGIFQSILGFSILGLILAAIFKSKPQDNY
jgi:hypothetical protein